MVKKFPPSGYTAEQYPLPHNFRSSFGLGATSAVKGGTTIPILRNTENSIGIEGVTVNPANSGFAEETGMSCFPGSIVPRINFNFSAFIPEAAIATGVRHLVVKWMPIYFAFIDSLEAENHLALESVEDILEFVSADAPKAVTPIYATKLFSPGNMPLNTITETEAFGDWGLSVDATYEGIAFDEELFWDAKQFFSNASMLSMAHGPIRSALVKQDRPLSFSSNNRTFPRVKRINPFTYCGIHMWLPQADTAGQTLLDSEITDIEHLHVNYRCRFDEWNPNFDQTMI